MSGYRVLGVNDDTTTCEACGKEELKRVVMLGVLDADNNVEGTLYAGTTCAARKLRSLGQNVKASDVSKAADAYTTRLRNARMTMNDLASVYGPEIDMETAVATYRTSNSNWDRGDADARARIESIRREIELVNAGTLEGTRFER